MVRDLEGETNAEESYGVGNQRMCNETKPKREHTHVAADERKRPISQPHHATFQFTHGAKSLLHDEPQSLIVKATWFEGIEHADVRCA
jgi:hypothetical protein